MRVQIPMNTSAVVRLPGFVGMNMEDEEGSEMRLGSGESCPSFLVDREEERRDSRENANVMVCRDA